MSNAKENTKIGSFSNKGRCAKCGIMYFHGSCNSCAPEKKLGKSADGFQGAVLTW